METIVYPDKDQPLAMHRHERDRVVVAFTDGVLKITNDKGKSHDLKLVAGNAYYLPRDVPGELHKDKT